ncbi:MAG TPA: hypothetical protein DCL38_01885 [Lachnospiraceae bacterium]|nr:hypothetical protein [Lachnospiraceae bacterium]
MIVRTIWAEVKASAHSIKSRPVFRKLLTGTVIRAKGLISYLQGAGRIVPAATDRTGDIK